MLYTRTIKILLLTMLFTTLLSVLIVHTALGQTSLESFDPGKALEDLKQNNAVVGILYSLVFIEAVVIVFLWKRLDKSNDTLIQNYKERIEREENLHSQIARLNTEVELIKQKKTAR